MEERIRENFFKREEIRDLRMGGREGWGKEKRWEREEIVG